jgi:hypothetical protein
VASPRGLTRLDEKACAIVDLVDRLAAKVNARLKESTTLIPAIAPRAATSDGAPAVGAAILRFSNLLLPTRYALIKTAGSLS